MLDVFQALNPYYIPKDFFMQYELDDVNRVVFFMSGSYKMGFEVNKNQHYKLLMGKGTVMGAYECFTNKRSVLLYRTKEICKGFFVFKPAWKRLEKDHPLFMNDIKLKLIRDYAMKYRFLKSFKDKLIEEFNQR
jgi:hypothetical protein